MQGIYTGNETAGAVLSQTTSALFFDTSTFYLLASDRTQIVSSKSLSRQYESNLLGIGCAKILRD